MTEPALAWPADLDARARQSLGSSDAAIYRLVEDILGRHGALGGRLVDAGCGRGGLLRALGRGFDSCCGLDAVAYEGFPRDAAFHRVDLDADDWGMAEQGDVVAAVETIEHLENPWAFLRRLAAMARPGGWVVVTTPNQLSVLSLVTLVVKHRFSAFQDSHFPAHRTALLPADLCRAATACGLRVVDVAYSLYGRVPLSPWHYPAWWARLAPRLWSDNVAVLARKPHE
jgi:2-polyprenyl-3-methyl-5-hydroxy-6-metoxy-1,4-benzoquinol methylase